MTTKENPVTAETENRPALYRPKGVALEARQLLDPPHGNGIDLAKWCDGQWLGPSGALRQVVVVPRHGVGPDHANPGDWIVKGTHAFMVYSDADFHRTYEPVTDEDPAADLAAIREQASRYLTARFGEDYVYRAPETFSNLVERWIWAVAGGSREMAERCMAAIEKHAKGGPS